MEVKLVAVDSDWQVRRRLLRRWLRVLATSITLGAPALALLAGAIVLSYLLVTVGSSWTWRQLGCAFNDRMREEIRVLHGDKMRRKQGRFQLQGHKRGLGTGRK